MIRSAAPNSSKLTEKQSAALAIPFIEAAAHERDEPLVFGRAEVLVTLPGFGQVPCDAACEVLDSPDHYGVIEAKFRLTDELVDQALRWAGYVNYVWVVYQPASTVGSAFKRRRDRLARRGVGRIEIIGGAAYGAGDGWGATFQEADTRLFAKAYHSSTGAHDPEAGSAGVKRITETRTQWEPLRKYLADLKISLNVGERFSFTPHLSWKEIANDVPAMRAHTAAQLRKAIDKGEAPGLGYKGKAITKFFATEKSNGAVK